MAALLHDLGKIRTRTVDENGDIHFIGHERASARLAGEILRGLEYSSAFIREVEFLVYHHMDMKSYGDDAGKLKDKKLRKYQYLCRTAEQYDSLLTLIEADNCAHRGVLHAAAGGDNPRTHPGDGRRRERDVRLQDTLYRA